MKTQIKPDWEVIERIRSMLCQVNLDCAKAGETVVRISAENAEYFEEQLFNLDYKKAEIEIFINWLKTKR